MPELTPQELAKLLEKLDDVCRQAQELAQQIKQTMAARKRGDYQSVDADRAGRRPRSGKRTKSEI